MVQDLSTLTAFIDGEPFRFQSGDTLLNYIDCHKGRGFVPTLCDAPQLEPYGACRVCSVEVALQADGPRRVVASCHTPLSAGMHVFTESPKVRKLRKNIVELVLTDHPLDCLTCEVSGNCELQTVAAKVGIRGVRYPAGANHLDRAKDHSHPYMTSELAKCINCSRCVRACDEIQGQHVLSMHGRGFNAKIIKGLDQSFADSGFAFKFYNHRDRLRKPLIKQADGSFAEATWAEAYDHIFANLTRIKKDHGGNAVAGISSARCTNEENYLMQKFIRAVMGTNNIDCCARVCHSPTAWGMQKSFGTGAATNSAEDLEYTKCILVIGANPTEGHPVTGARLKQQVMKGVPLIVIDPRKIELVPYAKHHLQLRPGTNVALLNLFARFILDAGLVDTEFVRKRCENWDAFESGLRELDIDALEKITGVDKELVRAAALEYATSEAAMSFHGLGVTEHEQGAKTVMLISNLAMMTGNIGRPGVGVNPLRGQNNVQGAADMGCQPHQGAGYFEMDDVTVQKRYADFYGMPSPTEPGWKIPQMFDAAIEGKLKALWLMGEDVVQTDPDVHHVRHAMESLEFLVVQEIFMTETAKYANVILPASSFLEKSGTFTNAERRVQRVNAAVKPLSGTKPDGQIMCEVLQRFGFPQPDYTPDGVLAEIAQIVPFFQGATWENLSINGKQWPIAADGTDTQILHQESFKRGLGKFHFFPWIESTELKTNGQEFPFILTTGRILEHYNCGTMTRRTDNVRIVAEDVLAIHPDDARRKGIATGDRGILYTTFHFPDAMVNNVTGQGCDGDTMCPEYKVIAADVEFVSAGKPKKKRMMEMV
ncbi:MAG: molybdopterin-dependent oxidoreductase [Verrucomicrobia bacterium]|nr:molybdopterin-dependent oxidoreductase [Verrucomicrobiota bacterium]